MKKHAKEHHARKRFGQNFLHHPGIIDRIISAIDPKADQHLVEIGPGKGALTEHLIKESNQLDVIELDKDLIPLLEQHFGNYNHFTIYQADALEFSLDSLVELGNKNQLRLVGNLPYNISTPLIFHLLAQIKFIKDMHFMLQKEVVDRLTASPGTKAYGRLSILAQYLCHTEKLFLVPPEAFNPVPKVESAIIRLTPKTSIPDDMKLINAQVSDLEFIAKTAFTQRRKTLRNNLKKVLTTEQIQQCEIDPGRRAETLSISEFVALTNQFVQLEE